jgi:hypothetical protein
VGIDPADWQMLVGIAATMRPIAPDASLEDVEQALRRSLLCPWLTTSCWRFPQSLHSGKILVDVDLANQLGFRKLDFQYGGFQ